MRTSVFIGLIVVGLIGMRWASARRKTQQDREWAGRMLEPTYVLAWDGLVDKATESAFRLVFRLGAEHRWSDIELLIKHMDLAQIPPPVGTAFYMATHWMREHLPSREAKLGKYAPRMRDGRVIGGGKLR